MTSISRYAEKIQRLQDSGNVVAHYNIHVGYKGHSICAVETAKLNGNVHTVFFDLQGNWLPKYKKVEEIVDNE